MAIIPTQLARVSNLLRTSVSSQQLTRTQQQLLDVQNELATGKRLITPSDDPGDSAIAQQLRKMLEQRTGYLDNLKQAGNQLSMVDATMGELTDLLQEAQQIASANVGSDVTAQERASAAAIVESIYSQVLGLANKQFEGVYLFAGDRLTDPPFVEEGGGVKFVGSTQVLSNAMDEGTSRPFMVNADDVFGAVSTRVEGKADLSPAIAAATRLADLGGALGKGVRLGSIQISNGTDTALVDLSAADTIGDVIDAIDAAGVGGITAGVAADGVSLELTGAPADDISVNEVGGGTTAADLGILTATGGGAGVPVDGASVLPRVTALTPLADLRGGAGIDTTGFTITNGLQSADVDLSGATTVQDLLNAVNGSGTGVRAEINAAGTGINILNPNQGTRMTIAEDGGTTATDLGVRSFGPDAPLSELNLGKGVRTVDGDDLMITDSAGTTFSVDITGATTVQDVIDAINTATGGTTVTASFATTGANGIVLTDTAGGGGTLTVTPLNFSEAAKDLGLLENDAVGGVITGADVDPIRAAGVFANLARLRDALQGSDQAAITEAAEGLKADLDRVARVRGETGARVQEIENREERLADQNLATKSLLSSLEDTDFTEAISRFQTLQTALQASLQTAGRTLNMSLLDFLR